MMKYSTNLQPHMQILQRPTNYKEIIQTETHKNLKKCIITIKIHRGKLHAQSDYNRIALALVELCTEWAAHQTQRAAPMRLPPHGTRTRGKLQAEPEGADGHRRDQGVHGRSGGT